jgi:hypothetical protein
MNLLDKYLKGDCRSVYAEIERMGPAALEKGNLGMVEAVLRETMNRVAYNLGIIYSGLVEENYCFQSNIQFDFEYPLLEPFPNAKERCDLSTQRYQYRHNCQITWSSPQF